MKRVFLLAAIVAALITVPAVTQAAGQRNATVNQPKRTGVFARMMELERRKNAAIRRMLGWE